MSRLAQTARAVAVLSVLCATTMVAAAPASAASTAEPSASASRSCSVGNSRGIGFSYVLSISATGTTCATARSVIRSYKRCKPRGGKCGYRIRGFSCNDRKLQSGPTQYDARGTCSKRGASIRFTYTQFR